MGDQGPDAGPGTGQASAQAPAPGTTLSEMVVLPPGPINRNKRHLLAKFMQANPGLTAGSAPTWRMVAEPLPTKQRLVGPRALTAKSAPPPPPLLLERVAAPGQTVQRGVPEGGFSMPPVVATAPGAPTPSASSYFLFVKAGKGGITAYPLDLIYGFKPPYRRTGATLEDAERRMKEAREAAENRGSLKMVPKSLRSAAERLAEERAGLGGKALSMEQALAELFGDDEEGGAGGLGLAGRTRKAPAVRGGGGGRGRGRGRAVKGADGVALDVDELAEDIFEGLEGEAGELRPGKPAPAEDWEHKEEYADDDLDQGAGSGEELEDDPGERIKLGLEEEAPEEEDEQDEAAKKLKQKLAEEEAAGSEAAGGGDSDGEGEGGGGDGSKDETGGGEDDEDLDLDELATSQLTSRAGAAASVAASAAAVPAPAAVGKRKQPTDASGAGPADGAKRARTAGQASSATGAGAGRAAGGRAAGGTPPPSTATPPPPAALPTGTSQASAAPSMQEIKAAVLSAGGSLPMNKLRELFAPRLRGPGLLDAFKRNMMAVLKLVKGPDGAQLLQLK